MADSDYSSDDAPMIASPNAHVDPTSPSNQWEEYRRIYCPYIKNTADYTTTEQVNMETTDYLDHTFCGIMFNVEVKQHLPVDFVEVQELWVRGELGDMTIWVCDGGFDHENYDDEKHWTQIYEKTHAPSQADFACLPLAKAQRVRPGGTLGIYIHSKARHDRAVVYDNSDNDETRSSREDDYIDISSAFAHLSWEPFGPYAPWGHSGWRRQREFVGRVVYGIRFKLFQPIADALKPFPAVFAQCVRTVLLAAQRQDLLQPYVELTDAEVAAHPEIPLWHAPLRNELMRWRAAGVKRLPLADAHQDCIWYLFNFCRWDWFKLLAPGRPCIVTSDADVLEDRCPGMRALNRKRLAGSVCDVMKVNRSQATAKVTFRGIPEWRTLVLPMDVLAAATPAEADAATGNELQARRRAGGDEAADEDVEGIASESDEEMDEDSDDPYEIMRAYFKHIGGRWHRTRAN